MPPCKIHNHSSHQTAVACYSNRMRIRADRKLRRNGVTETRRRITLLSHEPPRRFVRDGVEYIVYQEDERMQYGE
jgi:hypothetical protein